MNFKIANIILDDILRERFRQDVKFGLQRHSLDYWICILGEEFGEAAKAVVEYLPQRERFPPTATRKQVREELVQVAAVAAVMIEQLDEEALAEQKASSK